MASGIFTLKQQEDALIQGAWSGQKTLAVDYLVVAGGGGGGSGYGSGGGGGGGAGGMLQGSVPVAAGASITVTVGGGGGGASSALDTIGTTGSNSVFGSITASGGGGGRSAEATTRSGGSGGSGGAASSDGLTGQGTFGQGNASGNTNGSSYRYEAGGGGGAGTVGLNAKDGSRLGANGGAGRGSNISGPLTTYSGGGGGAGAAVTSIGGLGGVGGGGGGYGDATSYFANGTANTGGGGGGHGSNGSSGANGGSGIVIISYPDTYPAAASTTGSPTVSTSGSGAISFSGTSQYIQYADNAAFDVGSGDFTIECWLYRTATGRMGICAQGDNAGTTSTISFNLEINASNQLNGVVYTGSTSYSATASTSFGNNAWTHVAFVRDGNTTRIYSGGVQAGTASVTGVTVNNSSNRVGVGSVGEYVGAFLFTGYITNLRIVKGTCLYPSGTTFTPSTTPLTAISGTSILLLANSGAFSADSSTNAFFAAALGNSPTWVDSSPFSVTGYKNRVYKWTSSGSITF